MKTLKNLTRAAIPAIALTLFCPTPSTRADDNGAKTGPGHNGPRRITFQKCFVADAGPFGGHFEGTVAGDCGTGTVVFNYLAVFPGTPIVRFTGEYKIATPECSITTVCGGFVDTSTGNIVLNGVVTAGANLGDQVQVLADATADLSCSKGTITITPIRAK